jgi:hypothetical protein
MPFGRLSVAIYTDVNVPAITTAALKEYVGLAYYCS